MAVPPGRLVAPWLGLVLGILVLFGAWVFVTDDMSPCGSLLEAITEQRPHDGRGVVVRTCLDPAEARWPAAWAITVLGVAILAGSTVVLTQRRLGRRLFGRVRDLVIVVSVFAAVALFMFLVVQEKLSLERFLD